MKLHRLTRQNGNVLEFVGDVIADVSSRDEYPDSPRWTEIRIYRTADERWVVEQVGRSVLPGEVDRVTAHECRAPARVRAVLERRDKRTPDQRGGLTKIAITALEEAGSRDERLRRALANDPVEALRNAPDPNVKDLDARYRRWWDEWLRPTLDAHRGDSA